MDGSLGVPYFVYTIAFISIPPDFVDEAGTRKCAIDGTLSEYECQIVTCGL